MIVFSLYMVSIIPTHNFFKLFEYICFGTTSFLRYLGCSQSGDCSQNSLAQIWLHTRYESRNQK
jgi:hypothetical protein